MPKNRPVLLAALLLLYVCSALAQNTAKTPSKPCSEPQQKQFDFWLGDWDLTWPTPNQGPTGHGTNSVKQIMDGCIVQENFSGEISVPLRGMSVSRFSPRSGKWNQTWVDNQGGYIDLVGEFKDGQMLLLHNGFTPNGKPALMRMVYKNIQPNEFDWSWEQSTDGGKSWQVLWPIHYKRKS